jgi:hypothetical protein
MKGSQCVSPKLALGYMLVDTNFIACIVRGEYAQKVPIFKAFGGRSEDTECDVVCVGRADADVVEDDGRDGDGAPDDELETHGDEPMPPDCGDCTLPTVVVDCRPDDEPGGEDDEVRVPHDPRQRVHGGDEDGILDGTCCTMDEDVHVRDRELDRVDARLSVLVVDSEWLDTSPGGP